MMDDATTAEEKKQRTALLREITETGGQTRRLGTSAPRVHLHGVGINAHVVKSEAALLELLRLPAKLDRLRRGGYALAEIHRLRRKTAQICDYLDITKTQLERVLRTSLHTNLARFAPGFLCSAPINARDVYLDCRRRRAIYDRASLAQAVVRGFLTRRLPRMLPWKRRIARCPQLINWEVLGEACVRTKADSSETNWSRMRRMQVVLSQGEILLCSQDASDRHDALAHSYITIHTDAKIESWTLSARTAVLKKKGGTEMPGICLEPCVVDETGLEQWITPQERKRLRDEILAKPSQGAVWWYACSLKPEHLATIEHIENFFKNVMREAKVRAAQRQRYQTWAVQTQKRWEARKQQKLEQSQKIQKTIDHSTESTNVTASCCPEANVETTSSKKANSSSNLRSKRKKTKARADKKMSQKTRQTTPVQRPPKRARRILDTGPYHKIRGLVGRASALQESLDACCKERARARTELENLRKCPVEGTREERPPLPKATKCFWMVSTSRRRKFGAGMAFDVSYQANFFCAHRAFFEASMLGNLRCRALEFLALRKEIAEAQGLAVTAFTHQYRRMRARKSLRARCRAALGARVRHRASVLDYIQRRESAAHIRAALERLNQQCAARCMQRAYRNTLARRAHKAWAEIILGRFGRFCLARVEVWRLLRLKAEQDAKVRYCLMRMRNRTKCKSFARWQEFREKHAIWRRRYEALRRRCANRTLCRTARTLARMRSELATGLLDTGVLHPRLGQLLGEFMQRKNLDLLLCRIADDFATKSRYGTPARTMESDARLLHHRKRYAHTPRRWQLPVADPHEALHDVLLPYYRFPLIDVSLKGQFLLCGFWRTMLALNGAYWAFSHTLRKACLRDLRVRGDEVLRVLSSKANAFASPVLVIKAASDPLIRVHAPSELCMQCDAFFPSKLQSRCARCGTARVVLEPKRRDRTSPRGNPDEESQRSIAWPAQRALRLQDLHAAFFRHLEGSQDRLLRRWLEVSPERFMLATPEAVRDHLDHESEWWAATQRSVARDLAACAGAPRQRAPLEPRAGAPQGPGSSAKRDTPVADVFVGHAISVPPAGLSSPP